MARITDKGEKLRKEHPDKYKLLVEAMNKTHGKVDNALTVELLKSSEATLEDVIRLGGSYVPPVIDPNAWNRHNGLHEFWNEVDKRTSEKTLEKRKELRRDRFEDARRYAFEETFLYRAMIKFGMKPTGEKARSWCSRGKQFSTQYGSNGYTYGDQLKDLSYAETTAMFMRAGKDLREAIISDEYLNGLWTEQARVRREVDRVYGEKERKLHPIVFTNEEWRRFQSDHIIKEFAWLANMPDDVKQEMHDWMDAHKSKHTRYRETASVPTLTSVILDGFRYPSEAKSTALVEQAYNVMEYMGIGVTWNFIEKKDGDKVEYRDCYSNERSFKVGAMLKKVSSMMRSPFLPQVKRGADPAIVREIVVEDLNGWSESQARGHWQFYVRADAPTEYPDIQPKKNKATEKVMLFKKSMTIDEDNPEDAGFVEVLDKLNNNEKKEDNEQGE